jgi:hypothetical protein
MRSSTSSNPPCGVSPRDPQDGLAYLRGNACRSVGLGGVGSGGRDAARLSRPPQGQIRNGVRFLQLLAGPGDPHVHLCGSRRSLEVLLQPPLSLAVLEAALSLDEQLLDGGVLLVDPSHQPFQHQVQFQHL